MFTPQSSSKCHVIFVWFMHVCFFIFFIVAMSFMIFCFVLMFNILLYVSSTYISEIKDTSPEIGKFFSDVCVQTSSGFLYKHSCVHCKGLKESNICVITYLISSCCTSTANTILQRRPSIMTPPGVKSETQLVKGEDLNLECIAAGL